MKEQIIKIVRDYINLFPDEYQAFVKQVKFSRENSLNKFGELKQTDFIQRKIYEMPETLDAMIFNGKKLSNESVEFMKTIEGARWFAKTFPDFCSAEKI